MNDDAEAFATEDEHLVPLYQKFPVKIVRGSGALLYDSSGREYVDLSGGYGVAVVGHANPAVAAAVAEQARKLITCHGSLYNDAREEYLRALCPRLPAGLTRLFFCNSGAEANEAALKFARKRTGRKRVLAFAGSYHGKTAAALSATWSPKYRAGELGPLLDAYTDFAPFGNLARASELASDETAAILVEPIQGESGIHVPPDDFLPGLRSLADERGALLIFDEVQAGFGRTGYLWASEHSGARPDAMTAAKGVAGGVPFGFCATTEEVARAMRVGEHTSTFGGNPLACAAAKAALEFLLSEHLLERAHATGEHLRSRLEALKVRHPSLVREVRGRGLMLAAELKVPVRDVVVAGYASGLVLLYSGLNVLRFLPPLVITKEQVDAAVEKLDAIFSSLPAGRQQRGESEAGLGRGRRASSLTV